MQWRDCAHQTNPLNSKMDRDRDYVHTHICARVLAIRDGVDCAQNALSNHLHN